MYLHLSALLQLPFSCRARCRTWRSSLSECHVGQDDKRISFSSGAWQLTRAVLLLPWARRRRAEEGGSQHRSFAMQHVSFLVSSNVPVLLSGVRQASLELPVSLCNFRCVHIALRPCCLLFAVGSFLMGYQFSAVLRGNQNNDEAVQVKQSLRKAWHRAGLGEGEREGLFQSFVNRWTLSCWRSLWWLVICLN